LSLPQSSASKEKFPDLVRRGFNPQKVPADPTRARQGRERSDQLDVTILGGLAGRRSIAALTLIWGQIKSPAKRFVTDILGRGSLGSL